MVKPKTNTDERPILIRFDKQTYEKIYMLKMKTRASFAEIVRLCVESGFDKVKKDLEKA